MKKQDVKVQITLSDGYERRFTEACLKVADKRETKEKPVRVTLTPPEPAEAAG